MRPSKTRLERQAPANPYLSEMELKQALQMQAAERRKVLQLQQLQEKADLLKHYENYAIGNQNSNDEDFNDFLQKRKDEINVYDEELVQANEIMNKRQEYQMKRPQKSGVGGNDYDNVNNMVQIEENKGGLSQGEIDRQKRLKLREEERIRRLHGIGNSAYDAENGKISFEQQQALKYNENNQGLKLSQTNQEKPKNEIFNFNKNNNANQNFDSVKSENYNEKMEFLLQNNQKSTKNSQILDYKKQETMPNNPTLNADKKILQNNNLEKFVSREKQQKYKDELDRQIALKQKEKDEFQKPRAISANMEEFKPKFNNNANNNYLLEQNISPKNTFNQDRNNPIVGNNLNAQNFASNDNYQRPKSVIEFARENELEKKKKYAEELKWQMDEKQQEKMNKKNQGVISPSQNNQNNENDKMLQAKMQEKERKKKYAEELRQQMQEKNEKKQKIEIGNDFNNNEKLQIGNKFQKNLKESPENNNNYRPQRSYDDNAQNYYSNNNEEEYNPGQFDPRQNDLGVPASNHNRNAKFTRGLSQQQEPTQGVAFLNKMEDENKSRENQRKNIKQNYQEELKKQIEEKNRLKELEEKRKKEEEEKEMEKIELERQQMLKDDPAKSKGRKPMNAILAENSEKTEEKPKNNVQNESMEKQEINEPPNKNNYRSVRNEAVQETQESQGNRQFTAAFAQRTENKQSENELIYREENQYQYPMAPQDYHPPPQRNDSRSNDRYVTYEEFDRQTRALKEAIEDKLRLEQLNAQEMDVMNQYKMKIKEVLEQKKRYELEIEKLQSMIDHQFAHENYVDVDFISKALQGGEENEESRQYLVGMRNHLRDSMQIVDSLPTKSNLVYGGTNLDQSFRKDLEIFKAIHWNYFLQESQFIEKALQQQPPKTAPGRQRTAPEMNPLAIPKTKLGNVQENQEKNQFVVPNTQPKEQRAVKTPKMFKSMLRSSTQENIEKKKNFSEVDQKMVVTEDLINLEGNESKMENHGEKSNNQISEFPLRKLIAEESEVQSYVVNSNNFDERKLPLPMHEKHDNVTDDKVTEEEAYENEPFEPDEGEHNLEVFEHQHEIHMDEAKFNNEERSLVLADEELDEAEVENFIESEDKPMEMKRMSQGRETNSSNSKMARYKKPKTFDVFGKIQNTIYTNPNEDSIPTNRKEKALHSLGNYLDDVEKSHG